MRRTFLPALLMLMLAGCSTTVGDTEFTMQRSNTGTLNPLSFDFETTRTAQTPIAPPPDTPAAPAVTHPVASYLPITATKNTCLTCHDRSAEGKTVAKGQAKPVPASHFAKGADGKPALVPAQYNCVTCHVPPAGR